MGFFKELRRRKVTRVAAVYVVTAWVLLQVVDVVSDPLHLPDWFATTIAVTLIIGFPLAVLLAWAFELTPDGVRRASAHDGADVVPPGQSRIDYALMGLLAVTMGWMIYTSQGSDQQPPEAVAQEASVAVEAQAPAPGNPEVLHDSIAVLPFVNMSSDAEQEYFSDGISEELLNLLAKNPKLKVISRSSAFTFKGKDIDIPTVAKRLGVAHVLEGSVRKSGNTVRITAQLIDAETDSHLWSATYDRELTDIFAIQDEIAAQVVDALNLTLFGTPVTRKEPNLDAYALYLQGRHLTRASFGSFEQAEALLKQALALDPDYAEAWIELAEVYGNMRFEGTMARDQAQPLIHVAIERARAIDPENPAIYVRLANDAVLEERDLASAARYLKRGLALDPTNLVLIQAAAGLALNLGRVADAVALMEYVWARDPLCLDCSFQLSMVYLLQDRLDEAAATYTTFELVGGGGGNSNLIPAFLLLLQGKHEASLARWGLANLGPFRAYGETITLYSMGRDEEFAAKFQAFRDQYGAKYPTHMARIYAWMGDVDSAFEWLDRYTPGQPELGQVVANHWEFQSVEFRPLHDDPRWHAYLQRLGVAPEQLASIEFEISLPK